MCTCLDIGNKNKHYFGRTLDLEYHFKEEVVITPRNYKIKLKNGQDCETKYAIIGMATVVDDYPLYYEATNENGLSIAGLNFLGNAMYFEPKEDKLNLAVFELIPYILGKYKNISEIKQELINLNITNISFNKDLPSSPLHWMISDGIDILVMEQTKDGLKFYNNTVGVMTNNPTFDYQLKYLDKFSELKEEYVEQPDYIEGISFKGTGYGWQSIPGDYSSPSRFVKTAKLRKTTKLTENEKYNVVQFFNIMSHVNVIEGTVYAKNGKPDTTVYTSCINTREGIYYYKTYNNSNITAVKLNEENMTSNEITKYKLNDELNIKWEN